MFHHQTKYLHLRHPKMEKYKSYAGIGTRYNIPRDVELLIYNIGIYLARRGIVLRSGGAIGTDSIFEDGCDKANGKKEIYTIEDANFKSDLLVKNYHPMWNKIKNTYVKKLLSRNMYQIFGKDLKTPCNFVVCYTADGVFRAEDTTYDTGGTGTGIRAASMNNIPVYNLGFEKHYLKWHHVIFDK